VYGVALNHEIKTKDRIEVKTVNTNALLLTETRKLVHCKKQYSVILNFSSNSGSKTERDITCAFAIYSRSRRPTLTATAK
jgi:hypothetical protein